MIRPMHASRRRFLQAGSLALGGQLLAGRFGHADEPAATPQAASPLTPLAAWGKKGTEPGAFDLPIGIAIGPGRELFVTDTHNGRVQRFDSEGRFLGHFAVAPFPSGIAVDCSGLVYTAPMMGHKICVFTRTGQLVREWGNKGTADGQLDQPGGIAVAPDGTIYVADQVNRRVQRFSPQGRLLNKWGEYGSEPGQFDGKAGRTGRVGGPCFIAVDPHGCVYTTEPTLGRIQKFSATGKPLLAFGANTTEPGGFGGNVKMVGPIAVVVDRRERIWTTATNHRLQRFSPQGEFLDGVLSLEPGEAPGQFNTPHGMVFDDEGHLYVCDAKNYRIQKFAVAEPHAVATAAK
jgi:tripartite motif-containing protein 71